MSSRPILDGIRVLDMTQYLAGPAATRLLAEMGADIVKIERPPHGDPSREYPVMNEGRSGYFVQQNRGKKSLCLDIEEADGREILDSLLERADVFVENYGPGVLERRGLDWASLHAKLPRLVMASISGYGREGAYSHRTAFDMIAQAQSGIMHITGSPDGPPMPVGTSIGDVGAGVHAATGIGYALFHRERTGKGQHIDISMVDALFHMHELAVQGPALTGFRWRPTRPGHQSNVYAPQGAYKGPEGWIAVHAMARQWPPLCEAMGHPELAEDERFNSLSTRQKNRVELNAMIESWMGGFESDDDVIAALDAERVPCAKVMEPRDAIGHPHFESRGMIRRSADPILDEVIVPGSPLRFSEQKEPLELQAPLLGEHNASVLAELGYDEERIEELTRAGILVSENR
jgi:CoA:oxalate CoA-transferase